MSEGPSYQALPTPILKDKRAWWLYLIPVIVVALVPVFVVIGLLLLAWGNIAVPTELLTLLGTLAATALGGAVNMLRQDGSNGQ